jgi:hypothetical protein
MIIHTKKIYTDKDTNKTFRKKFKKKPKQEAKIIKAYNSYAEYLASEEWAKLKEIKLKQSDNRCQVCYKKGKLHIHHRTYIRIFHEKLSDLTALCPTCHLTFHQIIIDNKLSDEDAEMKVQFMLKKEFGY